MAARAATRGASGTVIRPRCGRSRSKITSSMTVTSPAASSAMNRPRSCAAKSMPSTPTAQRAGQHLQPQHGRRNAVVECRDACGVGVDHLVERLDVEPRSVGHGRTLQGLTGERPQPVLQRDRSRGRGLKLRGVGDRLRQRDASVGVLLEQRERVGCASVPRASPLGGTSCGWRSLPGRRRCAAFRTDPLPSSSRRRAATQPGPRAPLARPRAASRDRSRRLARARPIATPTAVAPNRIAATTSARAKLGESGEQSAKADPISSRRLSRFGAAADNETSCRIGIAARARGESTGHDARERFCRRCPGETSKGRHHERSRSQRAADPAEAVRRSRQPNARRFASRTGT